jgi:hypothetical protein
VGACRGSRRTYLTDSTSSDAQHHCRQCGRVVCTGCSDHFIPIPAAPHRSSRVCDECFAASIRNSFRKRLQASVDCACLPPTPTDTLRRMRMH